MDEHARDLDQADAGPIKRLTKITTGIVETKKRRPMTPEEIGALGRPLSKSLSQTLDEAEEAVRVAALQARQAGLPQPEAGEAVLKTFAGPRYRPEESSARVLPREVYDITHDRLVAAQATTPDQLAAQRTLGRQDINPYPGSLPQAPHLEPKPERELSAGAIEQRRLIDSQIDPVVAELREVITMAEINIEFLNAQRRRWYAASDIMAADIATATAIAGMCRKALDKQRNGLEPPIMAQKPDMPQEPEDARGEPPADPVEEADPKPAKPTSDKPEPPKAA